MDDNSSAILLRKRVSVGMIEPATTGLGLGVGRKPSERFMRKPLQARSKTSSSERMRISDLVEKLLMNEEKEETVNEQTIFHGYRPGQAVDPG